MALSFHDFILLPQFCVCVHVCDFLLQKRTSGNQKTLQMNFVVLKSAGLTLGKGLILCKMLPGCILEFSELCGWGLREGPVTSYTFYLSAFIY